MNREDFISRLPNSKKRFANDDLLNMIEAIEEEDNAEGTFVDMVVDNENVLSDGRYKTEDYVNACRFVAHYLNTERVQESYDKTFPDKYLDRIARGISPKTFTTAASQYLKGKLVQRVLAQSQVSLNIFHTRKKHMAVEKLYELMNTSKSERIQMDSADKLLLHLKDPEESKIELNITDNRGDYTNDLENQMKLLAARQLDLLKAGGINNKELVEAHIIEVEEE